MKMEAMEGKGSRERTEDTTYYSVNNRGELAEGKDMSQSITIGNTT